MKLIALVCCCIVGALPILSGCGETGSARQKGSEMIRDLIAEASSGKTVMESSRVGQEMSRDEIQEAEEYIEAHKDYSAYHLLFALRAAAPSAYKNLADATKAEVLCSALANVYYLNDWGYMDTSDSYDSDVAAALIETGEAARGCLEALLDDERPAPLFGSEEATLSNMYKYRRNDFAYRYLSRIMGLQPKFDPDPRERDKEIERLKARLQGKRP